MSAQQMKDWNMFHLILEAWRWEDLEETERRFEAGEMLKPEATRILRRDNMKLEARYHAPVNMLSLKMTDFSRDEMLQAHFLYDDHPERILEWMVATADQVVTDNFEDIVRSANGNCAMILFERSNMEIYEVKPGASTNA